MSTKTFLFIIPCAFILDRIYAVVAPSYAMIFPAIVIAWACIVPDMKRRLLFVTVFIFLYDLFSGREFGISALTLLCIVGFIALARNSIIIPKLHFFAIAPIVVIGVVIYGAVMAWGSISTYMTVNAWRNVFEAACITYAARYI